jgi:hypothetical protein
MPRLLELFCGTKSISKVFVAHGWDAVTLDFDPQFAPDICGDILTAEITGEFDMIWASPPCTTFSVASIGRHWKHGKPSAEAVMGNKILARTIEIINLFRPAYFFIENPRGMMRTLPIMASLPHRTVTYCQYGDTRQKPTDIWSNAFDVWPPRPMCNRGDSCHEAAPRGARTGTQGLGGAKNRSVIPPPPCRRNIRGRYERNGCAEAKAKGGIADGRATTSTADADIFV